MSELIAHLSQDEIAAARRGRTWPMLFVKQALSPLPVDDGFKAFADLMQFPNGTAISRVGLTSARTLAESRAARFQLLDAGGERFTNQPSRIIGDGDQRVLDHVSRSMYVAAFDQATVRGRSQLVELAGEFLLDFEGEEYSRIDDEIELDSAAFRRDGDGLWAISEPRDDTLQVTECFSLLGPNSFAFGHWIVEYLPRLWTAMQSGLMPRVPVLIDQGMNRQHRQCLEMLLGPAASIIEVAPMQRVQVGRLWFSPTYYYAPIYPQFNERFRYDLVAAPPDRFRDLFAGMGKALGTQPIVDGSGTRLFLGRRPNRHRKLVNHAAIEQIAVDQGFRLVYLEDFDFDEQLRLIRGADWLVGPEGSAFFVAFFANPGTRVGILNHPHTEFLTEVTALLEAVGVECTVVTGPFRRIEEGGYTHFSDYEIDPDVFGRYLREG
jgi:hypothetical protein